MHVDHLKEVSLLYIHRCKHAGNSDLPASMDVWNEPLCKNVQAVVYTLGHFKGTLCAGETKARGIGVLLLMCCVCVRSL